MNKRLPPGDANPVSSLRGDPWNHLFFFAQLQFIVSLFIRETLGLSG